jgi:hypothetical protein
MSDAFVTCFVLGVLIVAAAVMIFYKGGQR